MITKEQFNAIGISVSSELVGNAAIEWIAENTTLTVNTEDIALLQALPFTARLFISKYDEIMSASSIVASESIEGLSQSFNTGDKSTLLWQTAEQLLSGYLKGRIRFVSAKPKWRY